MASEYGTIFPTVDFVARTLPRGGPGSFAKLFAHQVIKFMKALDTVQEANPFVTIAIQTGGALAAYYRGTVLFQLKPQTAHLRLIVVEEPEMPQKEQLLADISEFKVEFADEIGSPVEGVRPWRCRELEIDALTRFLQALPVDAPDELIEEATHPRNFSGEVREAALQAFLRGGSFCRGVGRKRHKVTTERIEFDHILPYSKGGQLDPERRSALLRVQSAKARHG